ncbi:multidrug effflux MFS transporter [Hoeflea prorocentri]|uniref:Bcr/CflA family efflux transporter n=1 Tax=Hoeflea prorocentri TaxID=1922333 RepID=A0A9X3ZK67_9HYPH|nr:multidrug effflux MFS transporter [Hoeflea prorocentri]MCY6383701.1 multidrug effflux MFS transporter [Hoeflea prorocentri]MDA5401501.1 multidrug effflux MFS transporter [Hoeflea prorocentri]
MDNTRTPPHLITLILLTGFSPMSLNMFLPSLANITVDLRTDYGTMSWSVSGYLAVTTIIQLIAGPMSDRVGRRPVLLAALLVFTFASVGCAFAQSIEVFLFCRMLQGGIISGYALSLAIVRDTRSEREATSLIGYIAMAMAIAPMLGPMLGGVLDAYLGWRSVFALYAVAGFSLLILCWLDLGETKPRRTTGSDAPMLGTTTLVREPLFWAYALCGTFSVGGFYIFLTGAPLVAQSVFETTTAELGFYLGTITIGFMLGGFVAGSLGKGFEPTTMMIAGRVVACVGLLGGLALLALGITSTQLFFASTMFVGLGNGITMPGSNAGAMSIRPELAGSAAGLSGALIVAGGAVLTAVTGNVVSETSGAQTLLMLMLATSGAALGFAIWAARLKQEERATV